ncbi:chromosomal replication initiator protein DnaA [Candidatus Poriferisodalis sp.]|uniref:chromosomal replication initiator protein DnaA n=1 Tax=Candidatus Poriferisodalis sp. TaxID=3101277 RepID=UPI003B015315
MSPDELWAQCRELLRTTVSDALWLGCFRHLRAVHIDAELAVLAAPNNMIRDRIARRYLPMLQAAFDQLPLRPQSYRITTGSDTDACIPEATNPATTNPDETTLAEAGPDEGAALGPWTASATDAAASNAVPPERAVLASNTAVSSSAVAETWHPASGPPPIDTGSGSPATTEQASGEQVARHVSLIDGTSLRYTFDNFVTGSSNRFAQAAALSVAETPGVAYNPFFVYGGTGLGKTHLLQAIVNYSNANMPHQRTRYASTETFLSEFIDAIRMNSTSDFKRRYRELDILLLDDIQFMEGKERLQEELFFTFNSLHVAGKQIVLSSDRPPRSISTLSDRLRSRFEWGLITDIQPPDLETRIAILQKKAEQKQVPDAVLEHIAHLITNNIRELEGALVRVTAYASLTRNPITLSMAQQMLSDTGEPEEKTITTDMILDMTADMFGYDVTDLIGQRRQQGLVKARQISMYVMRQLTDLSYPAIASIFGGRDHTTVMHSVKKVTSLLPSERKVYDQVEQLIARVRAA